MWLSLTQRREEYSDGTVKVFDLGSKPPRFLELLPKKKLAVETIYVRMPPAEDPDLLRILAGVKGTADSLGEKKIEGRRAIGFHLRQPENEWTVWADTKTGLPIHIELGQPSLGRSIIMSEFKFDEQFEKDLFSTTAPQGYTVQKIEDKQINATEKDLLEGLRAVAKLQNGRFPVAFNAEALRETIHPKNTQGESLALAQKIQDAFRYIEILKGFYKVRNFNYKGDGVNLGDSKAPVIWWLPQNTENYHVIFGDLSVRDMPASELPKVDSAEGRKATSQTSSFHPYRYRETVVRDGGTSITQQVDVLTLSRRREVSSKGEIMIVDMSQKDIRILTLKPNLHKASLRVMPGSGPKQNPDLVNMVKQMQNGTEQDLGTRMIEGQQARGFHAALPGNDFEVWMNQQNGLPLLVELTHVGQGRKIIMSDFRFDLQLDEALFSTTPPSGYEIDEAQEKGRR